MVDVAASDDPIDTTGPVAIADRVWWVGTLSTEDVFQCHSYLVEAGDESILVDPGSRLTIDATLEKVARIVPVSSIRWLVCHHCDPDIAAGLPALRERLLRADACVVTEWRAAALLKHYDHGFPVHLVERHGWAIPLPDGRRLKFVLTPYLHFPGALCSYETASRVLFSSDLFGGFTDGTRLFARDESYFESIRSFHEHYMPSRDILGAGLLRIRRSFPDISTIAPQHGCIIREPLVDTMFERLAELECGIFLLAREDLDVANLMRVSATQRRLTDALVMAHDLAELASTALRILPDVLPVVGIRVLVETKDEGTIEFGPDNAYRGAVAGKPMIRSDPRTIRFRLPASGHQPAAQLVLELSEEVQVTKEGAALLARLAAPIRVALDRELERFREESRERELAHALQVDPLTGLGNRRCLDDLVPHPEGDGVLLVDIDHFKAVNDTFGHDAGDEVLRRVARTITQDVRREDLVVRYGGEEIVVILPQRGLRASQEVAERIRGDVAALDVSGLAPHDQITVSIGVAERRGLEPFQNAITRADEAMYRAKADGRNRVVAE